MSEGLERIACPHCREFANRLADYAHYLRQQGFPYRAVGRRIEEEIRRLIKEHTHDANTTAQ